MASVLLVVAGAMPDASFHRQKRCLTLHTFVTKRDYASRDCVVEVGHGDSVLTYCKTQSFSEVVARLNLLEERLGKPCRLGVLHGVTLERGWRQ